MEYTAGAFSFPHAVTSQPLENHSDVTVRPMSNEDADFVGRTIVCAFEGKFAHAAGRQKYVNHSIQYIMTFNY